MSERWSNRYSPYMASDNALCTPVVRMEQLAALMLRIQEIAESWEGVGPKPKVALDLEQLQVADYAAFDPLTSHQREAIRRLQQSEPVRADEMVYLALRSLITLHWEPPQSDADIRRAAAYEKALELTLTEASGSAAQALTQPEALLPYWGRLAFLRVMATIPEEKIESAQLHRFACVMLKDPAFNARSYRYDEHGLIGLNFALEPILKGLNRMLLHFFQTRDMAGSRRMERAWSSIVPVAAYFWGSSAAAANRLSGSHVLFDEAAVAHAHALTASQVDFIIRHELGHLVMDHAGRVAGLANPSGAQALRHELEFAADAFAQSQLRCALYSNLRVHLQLSQEPPGLGNVEGRALEAVRDHQAEVTAVRLLFIFMDAIEQVGQLLKRRLGDSIRFRTRMDSHPSARDRVARLDAFQFGEYPPTSQVLRYAQMFFSDLLAHAAGLDDAALAKPLSTN